MTLSMAVKQAVCQVGKVLNCRVFCRFGVGMAMGWRWYFGEGWNFDGAPAGCAGFSFRRSWFKRFSFKRLSFKRLSFKRWDCGFPVS
ncbi:MAG TPA: hypothetical protein VNR18_06715 [Hyphomicrobiales bacterium]|nr:hypothetical protein [Hyphomicrobiales bacterium]